MASASGARTAAMWGTGIANQNQNQLLSEYDQGYNKSLDYLGQAKDAYGGLTEAGQPGLDKYNQLTLGTGADIQKNLESLGSYQFNMDQGLQALARQRAAGGMGASGNADTDAMKFSQGLANNTLQQERQALSPYLQMYQSGTAGTAGALGNMAGLTTDYYGTRAKTIDNTNSNILNLGLGAFKAGADAKTQNENNTMAGVKLGTQLLGTVLGGPIGGTLAGGLTSMLGPSSSTAPMSLSSGLSPLH